MITCLRTPVAYLGDYTNVAIDEEGTMLPFLPFFTPKNFPKIYLGEELTNLWGGRLSSKKYLLSRELLGRLQQLGMTIKSIDVSRIDSFSYGQREIIVFVEDRIENEGVFVIAPMLIRLNSDNYAKSLWRIFSFFASIWLWRFLRTMRS